MKKLALLLFLLIPLTGAAASPNGRIPKARISAFITEYRHCEGVESVRLGRVAIGALKGAARIVAIGDPDIRKALTLTKGIRSLYVFTYEDCAPDLRKKIDQRLRHLLADSELLMEASDKSDRVQIFGRYDERSETVRDFVLYTPSEYTLVCIFGTISMDAIAKMIADD